MKKFTVSKAASKGVVMGKAFIAVQEKLEADTRIIKDSEKISDIPPMPITSYKVEHDSVLRRMFK